MEKNKMIAGEKLSREKFKTPSQDFSIVPFWFWNGEMDYEEMEYQMRQMKEKGCSAFYIHARFGVREELGYMNDAWLDRCKFTMEKAKELGMRVWIYDEYNWPSGTCGQKVMQEHPELTNVYLQVAESNLKGPYFMFLEGTDSRYQDLEESDPIYACAFRPEAEGIDDAEIVDLMPSLSFDKVISWEVPEGSWKMLYFAEKKSSWYTDVLNPKSTEKFLEYTHERYKEYLGEDFKDVLGFFTDEPAMHYFESTRDNFCIPWSKQMFKIFRERNGYDLRKNLPKLFYDFGGDTEQVRYDFWSTLSHQFNQAYFGQIHDWCKKNGVLSSGHLLYEESLRRHCRINGNLLHQLSQFDLTGIDHLYPKIGARGAEGEHVAIKMASSAAHQNGSVRLACESLGGSYWDCTMERMKWIADWEYALGVNQFVPHALQYTCEGERKRDWPPSMFYQFTWWEKYGQFNEYITRLGYTLSGGDHVAKIAILYPMNSMWANYIPQTRGKIGNAIDGDFAILTDRLLRLHMDFDYIDEDVLCDECTIVGNTIQIQGEKYELLLLPPMTHIKAKTMNQIEAFLAAGGKVMGDALLPYKSIEGEADVEGRIEKIFGFNPREVRDNFLTSEDATQKIHVRESGKGKAVFVSGLGFAENKKEESLMETLNQAVRECITPEIEIDNEEVFYLHRVKDGKNLFFLINPVNEPTDIEIVWEGEHVPEKWNLENGEITLESIYRWENQKTHLRIHMEPFESALYGFGEEAIDGEDFCMKSIPKGELARKADTCLDPIVLDGSFLFAMDRPNSLNVNRWKVGYADKVDEVAVINGTVDFDNWLDMKMGAWEMQIPQERDEKIYPVDLWYATEFSADIIPEDIRLMIDGFKGTHYELYINGRKVTEEPYRSYLDSEMKEVVIASYCQKGVNRVAVKLTVTKPSDGIIDILKIIGHFAVEEKEGRETIIPMIKEITLGDWNKKKLPYYSGTGYYTKKFNISKQYLTKKLMLECELGRDVLTVNVNGKDVDTRLWKPYAVDITAYLQEGENEITIGVINTLMNLLESSHTPSGLMKAVITPCNA